MMRNSSTSTLENSSKTENLVSKNKKYKKERGRQMQGLRFRARNLQGQRRR